MKKLALIIGVIFTLAACTDNIDNPLPDLNPGTPEGGEILIFDINDVIAYIDDDCYGGGSWQLTGLDRSYDWNNDGVPDLTLKAIEGGFFLGSSSEMVVQMRFVGQVLRNKYVGVIGVLNDSPVYLPVDGLTAGTAEGRWTPEGQWTEFAREFFQEGFAGPRLISQSFPAGISYIPTRTNLGGEWFYGWIEVVASDFEDADCNEFVVINRFGISQTPGLRIRMGQQ